MRVLVVVLLSLLLGCSRLATVYSEREAPERTLADITPVVIPHSSTAPSVRSLDELAVIYREVLAATDDPEVRLSVSHRLADIQMLASEERLAQTQPLPDAFKAVIESYEELLAQHPENAGNDRLLYQLSKAYDLDGDTEQSLTVLAQLGQSYPDSPYLAEAQFRMAEQYFANADYPEAERFYGAVIEFGVDSSYYTQAQYMHGWSRFKQGEFRASIEGFTATLDQLVPEDESSVDLSRGERELLADCLRVLAVVFSSLEGTQTIVAAYEVLGVRPYQHLLYEALGEHYLAQERFRDSAESYKAYTRRFPQSALAHRFALRVIETYEAGGFPDLIIEEKQDFVATFAVSGSYWRNSEAEEQLAIAAQLKLYIDELARYHHALAQDAKAKPELATGHYRQASNYYQLYIESFPDDEATPDMGLLLAESHFAVGDYRASIQVYEWVAYEFDGYERAADAAYSAIVAHDRLGAQDPASSRARTDSELRFAASFSNDPRAATVLGHAASALLDSGEYELAIISAATLANVAVQGDLALTAQLVMAHSYFELQRYVGAEQAYQSALSLMPKKDKRQDDTLEQLAASIYKQAEQAVADGDNRTAATQFARVQSVAPRSKISVIAQYDAANSYVLSGEFAEANRLLEDFRRRYPKHALTKDIPARLVDSYVQLEDWAAAAGELDKIFEQETDTTRKGQVLYLAAQYYDKASESGHAIERYRSYAHGWEAPYDIRLEAMNRLSEIYRDQASSDKQRYWLRKMVATHDGVGAKGSPRSLYLAAMSSEVLAGDHYEAFHNIKLQLPLKKSIRVKKSAMEKAIAAYQKVNGYGVARFATLATYRMGLIYQDMSSDLLSSERPRKLDALALEQYELLIEEQAYPFEEKAIAIWEANAKRSWEGLYDQWVQASFAALAELLPGRYAKVEMITDPNLELAVYNERGIALREQGKFAEAEQAYLDALGQREAHPDSHRNLGILYDLYMGSTDQALLHFNRYQDLTGEEDRRVAGWIADLERRSTLLVRGK